MKLTIKSPAGTKEVMDLNKDLLFNTTKGEQYIFSKGFTNYVLNFKDNQKSVELTFNIEGKTVKVELKDIVPFLQENIPGSENPTAIIINKNISDKDIDLLINNEEFNGSEIIDRLEAIISKPVELGSDVSNSGDLALISDFQTLIESLDAAAAGPGAGAGNAIGNGSTFNSIFSSIDDSLNGIADTNIWENLSESISTIPVESGPTLAVATTVTNVNVKLIGINTNITEGEDATYRVTLTDDAGNPIIATQDTIVTFTYTYITASGADISETISVTIPAGSSEALVVVSIVDDNLAEGTENFTIEINTVSNLTQFDSVTIDRTPVNTTITDETPPTTPDSQTAIVSITGPADVIEGDTTTPYTVSITQAPVTDLTVTFTYTGVAADGTDFTGVASVVIPAGQTSTTFTIATLDDNLAEGAEKFTVAINPSSLGAVGGLEDVRVSTVNNSVETTITDETPPTTPDSQTAIVSITGPADVIEGDTTTPYTVSITQAPVTDLTVTFTYTGVAADGTDFTGVASVVIPAGQTSTTFTIATLDDNLAEGAEKFTVAINPSSLGAVGGLEDVRVSTVNNSVETTITDETPPTTPDSQTAIVSITGPADVIEGDTTTPYTVSITQAPVTDLTVTFTYTGVAADGTDFTGVASVVIPAGQTSTTFTIATLDDNLAEGAEKFTVAINPSSLGAVGGLEDVRVSTVNNSVETTITDETPPTTPDSQTAIVSITGPADVIEGDTTTPYTVSITQAPVTDLTVTFTYTGVAADGTDFTGVASVVIPAGQTSTTFTIATLDDNLAEGAEKFTVAINPSSLGAVGGLEDVRVSTVNNSVETTITDETPPTTPDSQTAIVSITGPADVIEGDTTTPYTVSITQAPVTDLTVTFTYTGVAADGTDFTGVASVVIPAGQTSTTFTIATLDDNLAEGAEKFTVAINPSSLGAVGGLEDVRVSTVNNSVETTITDETPPTTPDSQTAIVSITGPADVIEGDTTTPYTVSITQAPVTDLTVTFTYTGVAADGTDFTGVASVVIPAGQTSTTFTIATLDDNLAEGAEKFTVAINPSSLGAVGGLEDVRVSTVNNSVETTITDETPPTTPDSQTAIVSITGPADVIEGDTTTPYTVSITQAPVTDLTVTFTYTGVAADGTDFTGVASVVIPAGQTSTTFTIATLDDNLAEGAEKFTVAINPSSLGAVGGLEDVRVSTVNNSVETTITDETPPTTPDSQTAIVSITGPADVIEGDTTTPYTVSITQAPVTDLTVTFTYTGVAADGTDFTGVASVVIPAGQTSTTFTIATLDDNLAEGAEKFTVAINPSSLGAVGGLEDVRVSTVNNSVETTITDETPPTTPDSQTAIVSITGPADVIEGDTTTPYTVSITQAPVTDLTVTFTYTGVAADGTDFTGVASVVIPAGQTSTTFTIATLDDNLAEGAEKFTVAINPSSLGAVGGLEDVRVSTVNNSVETTITDETPPTTPDSQTAIVSITGPADVIEGDTTTPYTVSITQAPVTDLTVTFTYTGVAADGTDFTGVASVVIPAGQTSTTFTIATLDDNLAEGAEKFTVAINPSSLGAVGGLEDVRVSTVNNSVETTITDETPPTTPDSQTAIVSITGPADVIEGDTTTPYTVSITQAPVTDLTVTFTYTGVAADGTDFTGVASVVIPAGQTSTTFTIATLDDNLAEGAEKFTVAINPSSLGAVGGLEDVRVSTVNNSVETTITDETPPTTPDSQTAIVSITGPADVIEGDTTTPYTVSITQAPVTDLTVTFTYTGVAADGTDFTGVASVVIPAGQTSTTFTIATLDDNLAEGAEKFTVAINPSSLGAVGGLEDVRVSTVNNSVETTITDETPPTTPDSQTAIVSITGPADVIEGDTTTPYTVSITQAPVTDLTVTFTYTGVAADGTDFTGVASVVIPAGQTSTTFTIATLDDNLAEGAEKFTVAINPSSLGAVGGLEDVRVSTVNNSVETTITDETPPTTPDSQTAIVSITGPADVIEGDTTTPYTVSITQAPVTDLTVTFTYTGVAADGTDFTGVASVVIPAGQTSTTFTIATLDDNLAEGAEKFTVAINPSSLGAVGGLEDVRVSTVNNSVETTITDETPPTTPDSQTAIVSITGPADVIEGDTTTPYTVSITQAPVTDLTVTFTYTGVAADGTDFTGVASVVIPAGQTSTTFTIATLDDNLAEGAEKFTVAINPSSLGAVGGLEDVRVSTVNNSVETTITDETPPTTPDSQTAIVSITGPADVIEGDTTTPYTVSITQAPVTDLTVTFTYTGVAADGTDFTGVASVVIPAGQTSTTFTIATLDDNLAEGAEKFTVAINPSSLGAVGGLEDVRVSTVNNSVETTITDETPPTTPDSQTAIVSITGPADVIEGDTTTPYTVSITQAPVTDLTVTFTYTGVAADGTDFTGVASVVIPAGQTSTTFTIATLDDNLAEGAEKFTVAINPSSLGAVGGLEDVRVSTVNNSVETTITDETPPTTPDSQTAIVSITGPADVIEGDTTTPYTVSITQAPVTDLTVTFTYTGVAADGTDFTGVASVVIPAGQTSTTFTIATLDDNLAEGAEKFTVAINPSSLGAVGGLEDVRVSTVNNSVETTITDETPPTTPDSQTAIVSITGPADVIEGDTTTPYTVSITQAPVTDLTVTFTYTGVAADGTDFTGVASVVIPAGQTSTTFTIATLDDNLAEGAEKFTVAINPSSLGAVGGLEDVRVSTVNNSVETTITDETPPTTPDSQTAIVSITGPADVIEGDTTTPYTVSITQAPVTDLTVTFTYTGVAADGTDFTGVASVVIPAGQTSTTFTIATLDDNLAEGAEKFTVAINPSSLGAVGGLEDVRVSTVNNSVETTITDETPPTTPDSQTAIVSITGPADVIEGDTTTPYTVSITQAPVTDLTVTFTYTGVAADGTDFTGVASVVIPAGQTSTTFTIATLDDNLAEGAEKFTVAINPSSLGAVGGLEDVRVSTVNNSVETTITDNDVTVKANNDTAIAVEDGKEFVVSQDELNDDLDAIGNLLSNDTGSNIKVTTVTILGTVYTLPTDGSNISIDLEYGQITINNTGEYKYEIDNSNSTVDALNIGDNLGELISYTISDGSNPTSTANLNITIQGQDDAPEINSATANEQVSKSSLFIEDFEGVLRGTDEIVGDGAWYVDNGTNQDGILVSNSGNSWYMNSAGVEMRESGGVEGLDTANGSDTYIEMDAHTIGVNSSISTQINLGTNNDTYDLSFDFKPRYSHEDSSDMIFSLDGKEVQINVDELGNITYVAPLGVDVTITKIEGTLWYKVEASFSNISSNTTTLTFAAVGEADTFGGYIDNIQLIGNDYSAEKTILTNIDLSDIDNTTLSSAKVEVTNYKEGDIVSEPTPNTYGITVTVTDGVAILTGEATIEQYEEVLKSLTFSSTSEDKTARTIEFTVNDGLKDSNTISVTLNMGGYSSTNDIPVSTNDEVIVKEDTPIVLSLSDFGTYSDVNGDTLSSIKINTLPSNGKLTIDGVEISAGTVIRVIEINNGKLVFTPNENTDEDGSFTFQVSDGSEWSSSYITSLEIQSVADEPIVNIEVGAPIGTNNDGTIIKYVKETINVKLGDEVGDSNINGTSGYNYTELVTKTIDFGVDYKNKVVELQMDVTVNGSWNNDGAGGYHDDNWTVFVNGVQQALFKYTGDSTSSITTEGTDNGIKEYNYGKVGNSNTNISSFNHAPIILIQLDENGRAVITFSASTTETAETVTINSIIAAESISTIDNPDYYTYPVDISAALKDIDGSESLSVTISGIPDDGVLDFGTKNADGTWTIPVNENETSITKSINLTVPENSTDFNLTITAKATEANDDSNGLNTTESVAINYDGDDIDLTTIISSNPKVDIVSLENSTNDKITVELNDLIADDDKQLIIRGDAGDIVHLDTPSDWSNAGKQELDGVSYNVFTGTGTNSTIKLLIDDDIDVTPDI